MKTAISIPDETFERARVHASALGMSRSEFFTNAIQRYLQDLDTESADIDAALSLIGPDDPDRAPASAARLRLRVDKGAW